MISKSFVTNIKKYFPLKNVIKFKVSKKSKYAISVGGGFLGYIRDKIPFLDDTEKKIEKHWHRMSSAHVIEKADKWFHEERYLEVYETLNKVKYSKDIEVIWRLARVLFNLSRAPQVANDVRKHMIEEAYEILERSKETGHNEGNYHKWMAVITNRKNGLESLDTKIRGYPDIRDHLLLACNNNPRDFTAQYMLGRWHYEMANLTWFQRKIAKYLFREPPRSTYQEAYRHLYKAEELNPRSFLPNMYMLGCVCMKLGQYYRARYYLNMAINLPIQSKCEECCVTNAKNLLNRLEKYHLGLELLSDKFSFVHGFEV